MRTRCGYLAQAAALPWLVALVGPAWGQEAPTLALHAGYTWQSDSNLFRLPEGANVLALTGSGEPSELIRVATAGLRFNAFHSLQRWALDLDLVDYNYQNHPALSFTSADYRASWHWALTPRFTGELSAEQRKTLNSYTDSTSYSAPNERTNTSRRIDGSFEIDGPWRVIGGLTQSTQVHERPVSAENDYRASSADLGWRYAFASGTSISYVFRTSVGHYLNRQPSASALLDDGYRESGHTLGTRWLIDAKTQADLSTTFVQRAHPSFGQRDFSGVAARARVNWAISAKTALTASWRRELASAQSSSASYTQTDRYGLAPSWQVTPKTTVKLDLEWAQADYRGDPGLVVATSRRDMTRDAKLAIEWQPYRHATVSAALEQRTRRSNLNGMDYSNQTASVSTQISY